jgi:hypothetical protein
MELREHCLWLSKRDTVCHTIALTSFGYLLCGFQGKDESLLCSLSNFDVYYVGKLHKAPKPFVFAVKSADNLSLFENASDYVHFFSCGQKDGETWMQAILLARVCGPSASYLLTVLMGSLVLRSVSGAEHPLRPKICCRKLQFCGGKATLSIWNSKAALRYPASVTPRSNTRQHIRSLYSSRFPFECCIRTGVASSQTPRCLTVQLQHKWNIPRFFYGS